MGRPGYLEDEVLVADPARPSTIADCPDCKGTGKSLDDPRWNCGNEECEGGRLRPLGMQKSELSW